MKTKLFVTIFVLVTSLMGLSSCSQTDTKTKQRSQRIHQFAGTPTETATTTTNRRKAELLPIEDIGLPQVGDGEILLNRSFYSLAFNRKHNEAAWVMWALASNMVGMKGNRAPFMPDSDLPSACRVEKDDYVETGFSRGHMMPAADCRFSSSATVECAFMSNICPQTDRLNTGPWNSVEMRCRDWAKTEGCVYIVCGPIYRTDNPQKIGHAHKLDVPDAFFKVVLSLKPGKEKALGFVFDNNMTPGKMQDGVCTVSEVEKITGLTFFGNIDPQIAKEVKNNADLSRWKLPNNQQQKKQQKKNKQRSNH